MRIPCTGTRWLAFSSLLVAAVLLNATPVKAAKTWSPPGVDGVTYPVEIFSGDEYDENLQPLPIFNEISPDDQELDVVCYRPVRVQVTVEVTGDARFPIQIQSLPGSPEPGKHPGTSWSRIVKSPTIISGEYWVMWRCSSCVSATKHIGALNRVLYYDNSNPPVLQPPVLSNGATVWNVEVQGEDVPCPAPVADLGAWPRSGKAPLRVWFYDQSTTGGPVDSWAWGFGDTGTSPLKNPDHIYTTAGSYTVTLTVTGPGGSDVKTQCCIEVAP